ncbi:MAG: hypothetical protein V3R46_05200, partial [Thermoplasmata archaeon]
MDREEEPSDNGAARFRLPEDLGLEAVDVNVRLKPGVGQEAGLHARLREELVRGPSLFRGHLREDEAARGPLYHEKAMDADFHDVGIPQGAGRGEPQRGCEEADFHHYLVGLLGTEGLEAGVAAG